MLIPTLAYQATLVVAILATMGALYVVLDRASRPGGRPLLLLLGGSLVWLVVTFVYTVSFSFEVALIASKLTYIGIAFVPIGWFLFALEYTGRDHWIRTPLLAVLFLEGLVVNALVWVRTDLIWTSVERTGATGTGSEIIEFGAWGVGFFAHAAFAYLILFVGAALVLKGLFGASTAHRGQVVSMLVAVVFPTVGNAAYLALSAAGILALDLTPIMFAVSAVAIVVGAYRYSLVDDSPLAAEVGLGEREDPAFLVDDTDTLVALNVPAAAVLGVDADQAPGSDVEDAFEEQSSLQDRYDRNPEAAEGLVLDDPLTGTDYVVNVERVDAPGAAHGGTLFVLDPQQ
ncbi:histidine kinase N-terminal 7TM domain-containing protein [Halorubellus litoreus]|uniref:Histidine kinase N-terminal 7TM domain-containing protein n=1 Tax=Halorubellus litoreus TaxID=755308 RepID=A0ABD5VP27_9EURY